MKLVIVLPCYILSTIQSELKVKLQASLLHVQKPPRLKLTLKPRHVTLRANIRTLGVLFTFSVHIFSR